eukprot:CAMPEP_0198113728 /NCGR_PEP_ID=MMETSP1442-20131203/5326_1 /TAXON_ID= /ORGANISM="Craspedostauros australis, Strain CCMP3328" /LENGTH=99 /DNA_ID=CAMNT_0043770899 /DNA_START=666 /DNA_END=965 /DNA_ORIENTATION=-
MYEDYNFGFAAEQVQPPSRFHCAQDVLELRPEGGDFISWIEARHAIEDGVGGESVADLGVVEWRIDEVVSEERSGDEALHLVSRWNLVFAKHMFPRVVG